MSDWLDKAAGIGVPAETKAKVDPPPRKKREGKGEGNPFLALRVPAPLLEAFKAYAESVGESPAALVRDYMAKVTGRKP